MNYNNHTFERDGEGRIIVDNFYDRVKKKVETRGKREKVWLVFDDIDVLFKKINNNTFEDYAELLAEEIYKQMGIPAAKYDLAILNGEKGVLSEDFLRKGETLVSGYVFLLQNLESLDSKELGINGSSEIDLNNLVTIEKVLKATLSPEKCKENLEILRRAFGVYCMTLQGDIHWRNWSVIYSKIGDYRLSPLYDSAGMCRFSKGEKKLYGIYRGYASTRDDDRARQYVEDLMFSELKFDRNSILKYAPDSPPYMGVTKIMEAFERDPIAFTPVVRDLLLIDPLKAINGVENKIHAKVPDLVQKWFVLVVNRNKEFLAYDLASYYTVGQHNKTRSIVSNVLPTNTRGSDENGKSSKR